MIGVLIKPLRHFFQSANAVDRLAGTAQFMIFPMEQTDPGIHVMQLEGLEHL